MSSTYSKTQGKPIFQPLLVQLRKQLADGTFQPGEMVGTELLMARRSRISRNSVRAAIDELVVEGLVERRPGKGVFARKRSTTRVIEIVVPALGGLWIDMARGAQACGREYGVKVHVFNAEGNFDSDVDAVRWLSKTGVDGAIIGSWHQTRLSQAVVDLDRSGFPVVFVDQRLDGVEIPSVRADDRTIGYTAGEQLLRLGHKRIGFIGHVQVASGRDRLEGLRDAINDAGLPLDRSRVMDLGIDSLATGSEFGQLGECVRKLFDRADRPTAVVLHRAEHAAAVYQAIRSLGLRIPDDVSVVGVGTPDMSALHNPTLAGVNLRGVEMGRVAMEMLMRRINDKNVSVEHQEIVSQWMDGASIAEAKADSFH